MAGVTVETEQSKENRNRKRREFQKTLFKNSPKTIDRLCKDCKKVRPCRRCGVSSGGTVQYKTRCQECWQKVETAARSPGGKHHEKVLAYKRKRMREAKQKCVDYLGGKCVKCNYAKSLRALSLHHKIRADKEFEMSTIKDHNWEKVKRELDKCILVCLNCHMEQEDEYESNKLNKSANKNLG